ncbi:MAG: helix-turn-helix domain-containing protein [Candidatus Bathyarchaeia archaeon]
MSLPCEVAVKCLLPPVRAMIAKTLTTKYNLTQTEAAKRLGISQPAISLYERKMRGKAINLENDPEITKLIENLAEALAEGDLSRKNFIQAFCEICRIIRSKGLLCQMHKTFDPAIDVEKCELCLLTDALKCM